MTPPTGADDGMLIDDAVFEACPDVADVAVVRPGVNVGGSGANAPSMQRSAQSAYKTGSKRVMVVCEEAAAEAKKGVSMPWWCSISPLVEAAGRSSNDRSYRLFKSMRCSAEVEM